ncbi:MAG: DJ-1 family glyoxalase III [Hydrogenobacter sp.]|uniref:DJ-1 family glyoxalase III n=1 Tax=Hydrogenobacter thermophilus TaxID=940 RepID=UPI0030FC3B50
MPKVAIVLADGFEEVEAIAPIDALRRADIEVLIAGLSKEPVISARGVRILPDVSVDELNPDELDMIVLPGGAVGVENLKKDKRVEALVKALEEKGKYVSAICAAPTALASFGILKGKRATVYPSLSKYIEPATFVEERVVEDGKIITSQGPGTALLFALKLVERLAGKDKAREVAQKMLIDWE